jgi:hypothetical protein
MKEEAGELLLSQPRANRLGLACSRHILNRGYNTCALCFCAGICSLGIDFCSEDIPRVDVII